MKTKSMLAIITLLLGVVVFAQAGPQGKKHIGFILDVSDAEDWEAQLTQIVKEINQKVEEVVSVFGRSAVKKAELCSMSYEIITDPNQKFKKKPDMIYSFAYSGTEEFLVKYKNKRTEFIFPRNKKEKLLTELQETYIPLILNLDEFIK